MSQRAGPLMVVRATCATIAVALSLTCAGSSGGGPSVTGGRVHTGGATGTGGVHETPTGGTRETPTGGLASTGGGGAAGSSATATGGRYVVSLVQSTKGKAEDLTQEDIRALVLEAVTQAGGLGFIKDGDTVVLKPNLLTTTTGSGTLAPEVNGVTTDWRLTRAVAELVRARDPSGKISIMEGSVVSTKQAFVTLGYTAENFGNTVDELIALEGSSCIDKSTGSLLQKAAPGGKLYWVNRRYLEAKVVISLPVMKTHVQAGITGGVKNLGIGVTPAGQYANGSNPNDCTRGQTSAFIDHAREPLAQFIHDYYGLRPADFVVMDGLQAIQHGPNPVWGGGNYATDRMNMRLVLASSNAVALDTVAALVMRCDPKQVGYLTKLEATGLGTTDITKIRVMGKAIDDVSRAFAGPAWACPGP